MFLHESLCSFTTVEQIPVEFGEDIKRCSIVSAASTDHLQVDDGRSMSVSSFISALFGLHSPQLFLLLGFPWTREIITVIIIIGGHCPEKLENSPMETKITACDGPRSSRQNCAFH